MINIKSYKKLTFIVLGIVTLLSLTITVIIAYLISNDDIDGDYLVGDVVVELEAFYEKDGVTLPIDINQTAGGVIELNISDPNILEHFNNFRVNIKIYSSVDTYFRVAVYEQFTLTYMIGDQKTIVAVVKDGYSKFGYDDDFYDNRLHDGFFYYKNKVKRNAENNPLIIEFIGELSEEDFHPIYESKYTLQVGFFIDAVQYLQGPEMNWGLDSPPWLKNGEW